MNELEKLFFWIMFITGILSIIGACSTIFIPKLNDRQTWFFLLSIGGSMCSIFGGIMLFKKEKGRIK